MKIKIIENTNRILFEYEVNCFVQQVKVINIQYSQAIDKRYDILKSAMIIYELEGEE